MAEALVSEAEQGKGLSPDGRVLLVMIASDHAMFDDLITALLDIGLTGATVIESKGMGSILREEMPIFAGLAALIPEHTGSRVLLSVTTREQAERVFQFLEDEIKAANRPIALTVPVERTAGLLR